MIKWIKILLTGIAVSLFYFPVVFTFFPIVITKNLMAAVGILFLIALFVRKRDFSLPRELILLLFLSLAVTIFSLISVVYNQTPDVSYAYYIRSAVIWLSGAFAVCYIIWLTHGRVDVPLLVNYLAAVCVFQCIMAMLIEFVPAVRAVVDATFIQGQDTLREAGRIYGIGAALDVGGSRFAAVLIAIAFMIEQPRANNGNTSQILLVLAFIIITVIGNIIARTTLVGTGIGLGYIVLMELRRTGWQDPRDFSSSLLTWVAVLVLAIPILIILYNASLPFQQMLRFGFEGFFSLIEQGKWEVNSNEILENMVVWPDNFKTWMIGDGYFENQRYDANYLGEATTDGFYMGTDIGYLRFIFYFGVPGLIAISLVMIYAGVIACKTFPGYTPLFVLGIAANFVVWLKVATDLFPFLSLCACLAFLYQDIEWLKEQEGTGEEEDSPPEESQV